MLFRLVFSVLILSAFHGCSSAPKKAKTTPQVAQPESKQVIQKTKTKKKLIRGDAVWHLIDPLGIEIALQHTGSGKRELVLVQTTLSEVDLTEGEWKVIGFVHQGQRYEAIDQGQVFEFEIKRMAHTYIGSFVVGCPKVSETHQVTLRKMDFFNRYSFFSGKGSCELIVGNDLNNVARAWSKLEKKPASKLRLGF